MIDAKRLLADLKRLHARLKDDLHHHHAASPGRAAVEAEWREAFEDKRTAETFATFLEAALDQAAVHWILAAVFIRFLEDNALIEHKVLAGPGERLDLARERQQAWFRVRPHDSDAEYLLASFKELAELPGLSGLFDRAHNPLFRLPLSGDGAMELIGFVRKLVPETGALVHDFTDPEWSTRWLGDLYQDLSEEARKRYALLQTPDFVEAYILDRTLDPAISEFGHEQVRIIDPACGSGHFLLGAFDRLLREWQRHRPDMPPAAQAQRTLDSIAGVDLNPFAAEIARFRLLLAALRASGETRLSAAPDFRFRVATGDSLLHGRHFARHELGGAAEGFRRVLHHHYAAEDTADLDRILGRQYHAVVGNPPYITPKDPAMRSAYREIYESCHMKYALAVPFIERFFDLAETGTRDRPAGFVGMIVAYSFMKQEFGKKLIENVLPRLDLTHIIDCSGAYIPRHGTPTAILFGRNRAPVASVVRAVMGIRGEPATPDDPTHAQVWSAIVAQTDEVGSTSTFVSVADVPRATFSRHPWHIAGGGAAGLKELIESCAPKRLENVIAVRRFKVVIGSGVVTRKTQELGFASFPGLDDAFFLDTSTCHRIGISNHLIRPFVTGKYVRDWSDEAGATAFAPYDSDYRLLPLDRHALWARHLWHYRTCLAGIVSFGGETKTDLGAPWWGWYRWIADRYRVPLSITFASVATHNHFVLDRGGKVFNRHAPVIKLSASASEEDHLDLLGLLNSSTACFWMKSVFHNKGSTVDNQGARQRTAPFEDFYEFTGTGLQKFLIVDPSPCDLAHNLDAEAQHLAANFPAAVVGRAMPNQAALKDARAAAEVARARMIALQEELDWRCYHLYGLLPNAPEHPNPPELRLGERAFEIVMARRVEAGELETTWFERHGSTLITEIPAHWPADYRAIVERRIALIETDPNIGLIERPEYKRRWSMAPWEEMEKQALRGWLLDRLEEPRLWPADDPRLVSTRQLADAARHDPDFLSVAELYAGFGFDVEALVAELVAKESVPFLAALRYSESGLRKRAQWEETWEKQRREDAIDAEVEAQRDEFLWNAAALLYPRQEGEAAEAWSERLAAVKTTPEIEAQADHLIGAEQRRRKEAEIGSIPVPPKYQKADFLTQDYWRLRNGLDVPKERFVSFPCCTRDVDSSLVVTWAGYDHLARARAIAACYIERKETDGWEPPRLAPLLAGLGELLPWLRQWHNAYDPAMGVRMGDYFSEFVRDEARSLKMTEAGLAARTPPAAPRRTRSRKTAA